MAKGKGTIGDLWARIEGWLEENADELQLSPGASASEIKIAETTMGITFPSDVRESYRLHNGSNRIWLFQTGYLMPLMLPRDLPKRRQGLFRNVVSSWSDMTNMLDEGYFDDTDFKSRPRGPITKDWWNRAWIPITYNESGDHACIDLSPAKGGQIGQVIDWWHERGATKVLASGFAEHLAAVAEDLESGRTRFDAASKKLKRTR